MNFASEVERRAKAEIESLQGQIKDWLEVLRAIQDQPSEKLEPFAEKIRICRQRKEKLERLLKEVAESRREMTDGRIETFTRTAAALEALKREVGTGALDDLNMEPGDIFELFEATNANEMRAEDLFNFKNELGEITCDGGQLMARGDEIYVATSDLRQSQKVGETFYDYDVDYEIHSGAALKAKLGKRQKSETKLKRGVNIGSKLSRLHDLLDEAHELIKALDRGGDLLPLTITFDTDGLTIHGYED